MKPLRTKLFLAVLGLMTLAVSFQACSDDNSGPTNPGGNNSRPHFKTVSIQGSAFNPSSLVIAVGDTVLWTNRDNTPHTVTSDAGTELGSSLLSTNQTYQHVFLAAGAFDYHCEPHPTMQASVTVQ